MVVTIKLIFSRVLQVFTAILLFPAPFVFADVETPEAIERIYNQGTAFYYGMGGEQDRRKACRLFEQAAAGNHAKAVFNLGNCYRAGENGEPPDLERAEDLYVRAAALGEPNAFVSLGVLHLGQGNDASILEAANQFFRIALHMNDRHPEAAFHYGVSLMLGRATEQDFEQGVKFIDDATAEGNILALAMGIYVKCDVEKRREHSPSECEELKTEFNLAHEGQMKAAGTAPYTEVINYFRGRAWLPL